MLQPDEIEALAKAMGLDLRQRGHVVQLAHALGAPKKKMSERLASGLAGEPARALRLLANRHQRQTEGGCLVKDRHRLAWRVSDGISWATAFEADISNFRARLADALQRADEGTNRTLRYLHLYLEPDHQWVRCGKNMMGERTIRSAMLSKEEVDTIFSECIAVYDHCWKLSAFCGNASVEGVVDVSRWAIYNVDHGTGKPDLTIANDDKSSQ